MYEQDWILRQIYLTVQMIAKLVLNKETARYEIINEIKNTDSDILYIRLSKLIDIHAFNEAENLLYEYMDQRSEELLHVSIDFYNKLNEFDDKTLEKNDYSRQEIIDGLEKIKKIFGIAF